MSTDGLIPTTPEEITAVWLTEALRSTGLLGKTAVTSLVIEPLNGAGYLGQIFRLRPIYNQPTKNVPATLIAKLPHPESDMREGVFWACERETFFYQELADQVSLTTPQCYFSDINIETFQAILLFEDLAHLRMVDLVQGCGLADAETIVTHLAQHHAQWWQDPRLPAMEAYVKPVNERWDDQEENWKMSWSHYEENIATLLPNSYLPASFLTMGQRASHQILNLYDQMAAQPFTFLHYDTHLDNLMFANCENDPALTVFDWQLIHYGPAVCDISYFFILSLPVSLRRQHERALLQTYHDALVAHGVTHYSFAHCWQDYRLSFFKTFDLLVGIVDSFDLTEDHGRTLIEATLPRMVSFAEDHRVEEFLL